MPELSTNIYVIDASVVFSILSTYEEDTSKNFKNMLRVTSNIFLCPSLITYEIGNNLKNAVKDRRILQAEVQKLIKMFKNLPLKLLDVNLSVTLHIALYYKLTYYDASYLYLCIKNKAQLLSLDKELLQAFNSYKNSPS